MRGIRFRGEAGFQYLVLEFVGSRGEAGLCTQKTELVVDVIRMAILRRRPEVSKTILHPDHGTQYTSWAFGKRLRDAGLLGSMGTVGD